MPIFSDDLERRESAAVKDNAMSSPPKPFHLEDHNDRILARKLSEESIRTELCEGPIPEDSPRPKTPENEATTTCSDRAELIERLKRGESPTWIPNRHLESIWGQHPTTPTRNPKSTTTSPASTLLPPATITPEKRDGESEDEKRLREGLDIERPRSALHSGDFTQDKSSRDNSTTEESSHDVNKESLRTGGHAWLATSPPRNFTPFQFERSRLALGKSQERRLSSSLSSSLSTNLFYQPPTSPLVQSESNDDIDLASPMDGINLSSSMPRNSRRHTLMSSHDCGSYGFSSPNPVPRQPPAFRQERVYPYQAHQPRRSLTSTPNFSMLGTSPQTPAFLRSRRPSYSSDTSPSPLQHASMVGSYEESILRGRMSTTPSKPLDFLAQIGVLGLGKCKSSLRCPAHMTLPFPAVFYSYASSAHGRSKDEDGPSPYVGQIDLENGLSNPEEEARSKRKRQSRAVEQRLGDDEMADATRGGFVDISSDRDARRPQRQKRRSGSPRAPPGGSYRIPEKGQIQIIIKNPNKTAVKLFLIPYDLTSMEPGTKTFIRQRSYSTGPIIDVPELKDTAAADRPILRYLVHLHICCPSRGRYYLYKSIRVVFANRVPDGKEKLRNEITLPEPRFTQYKPIRVMHPSAMASTGPGASLAADKAFRRRSSGFYLGVASNPMLDEAAHQHFSLDFVGGDINNRPVDPIPFSLPNKQMGIVPDRNQGMPADVHSPDSSSQTGRPTTQASSNTMSNWGGQIGKYDKLSKGDVGYGGNAFSGIINGSPGAAEGLLSQRLRSLGVEARQMQQQQQSDVNMTEE